MCFLPFKFHVNYRYSSGVLSCEFSKYNISTELTFFDFDPACFVDFNPLPLFFSGNEDALDGLAQ